MARSSLPPLCQSFILHTIIMLSLLKAVYAFSLSPLFLQAGATPFAHVSELQERYLPDHHGAVASESSICSNIGIDLLKQGGNAADAVGTQVMSKHTRLIFAACWHRLLHRSHWLLS